MNQTYDSMVHEAARRRMSRPSSALCFKRASRALLLGCTLMCQPLSAQIDFQASRNTLTLTTFPADLFSLDFDEDGVVDLVCLELAHPDDFWTFYKGVGDGTFVSPTSGAISLATEGAGALGDVDNDGFLDLVATRPLVVLRGIGPPSFFDAPKTFPAPNGGGRPTLGDLNGDDYLDVILLHRRNGELSSLTIFLGDQNADFTLHSEIIFPFMLDADLGDFDQDGFLDLTIFSKEELSSTVGTLNVYPGLGDANFGVPDQYTMSSGSSQLVQDINGDSWPDICIETDPEMIGYLLNDQQGGFDPPLLFEAGIDVSRFILVDLNEDGDFDFVCSTSNDPDEMSVVLSDGLGGYLAPNVNPSTNGPTGIVSSDFNGDGHADVAITGSAGADIGVYLGDGMGGIGPFATFFPMPFDTHTVSRPMDFDGDGLLDVIVSDVGGGSVRETWLLSGQLDNSFVPTTLISGIGGASDIAEGDFNLDGNLDIAIDGNSIQVFHGDGMGGFTPGFQENLFEDSQMAAADLNNDGWLDLVVTLIGSLETRIYHADGAGGYDLFDTLPNRSGFDVRIGDVDLDGRPDVALGFTAGPEIVIFTNGAGGFGNIVGLPFQGSTVSIVLSDFDGDGLLDAAGLGYNGSSGRSKVSILRNTTGRVFEQVETHILGAGPFVMETIDADGDGIVDLACATGFSHAVSILRGRGDGTFEDLPYSFAHRGSADSHGMAIGDFDRDGREDILLGLDILQGISLLYNRTAGHPSASVRNLQGGVNAGRGNLADVLFVNGSAGDPKTRSLSMTPQTSLVITMTQPPSRASLSQSSFALFLWRRVANDDQLVTLPFNTGTLAFNIPGTGHVRLPKRTWNNFGHMPILGAPDFPSVGAPSEVFNLGQGTGIPIVFTLQGIIRDDGAAGTFAASPTNGLVVTVE